MDFTPNSEHLAGLPCNGILLYDVRGRWYQPQIKLYMQPCVVGINIVTDARRIFEGHRLSWRTSDDFAQALLTALIPMQKFFILLVDCHCLRQPLIFRDVDQANLGWEGDEVQFS